MKKRFYVTLVILFWTSLIVASPTVTVQFIKTDQFGYKLTAQKIAIISNPITGYNNGTPFAPGATYQVRDWLTDAVVYTSSITPWSAGATQTQSGDKVWWFDFSTYTVQGSYYIHDVTNNVGSYRFEINDCVYNPVLTQAMRMYYYARCGSAKLATNATVAWADGNCHVGTQQDLDCRLYNNTNISTSKNLSGGWHDAGDYNKYVNFTWSTLTDMLLAYEENPLIWTDNYNIPETGNGVPDLLDEIKYELDWLLKMQQPNGSVLSVVGGGGVSPPSADVAFRRYGPANTSAALTSAAIFALAAMQFTTAAQTAYSNSLQAAAVNAYTWAVANPSVTFYNAGLLAAGEQEISVYERDARKVCAAIYLYALTGTASYKTFVDANYTNVHLLMWTFAYPFEGPEQDALLYYTKIPGATPAVKTAILNAYTSSIQTNNVDNLPAYTNKTDAYRAWLANNNYTWNSNQTKSKQGNMFLAMNQYSLNAINATNYKNAASGFVHYMHGVNPNSKTYLSNMAIYGAENSVSQFYHAWFHDGSALWDEVGVSTYGPPPGYIPGGPNPGYALDPCCPGSCGNPTVNALCATNVTPPMGQPIQKSYKDFNDSWPLNSWTISEAGIYTNAAYVRMLSKFCSSVPCSTITTAIKNNDKTVSGLIQTIYPQPAENKLTIKFFNLETNAGLFLYDVSGKQLLAKNETISNGLVEVDLSNIASGVYFLKVVSKNKTETRKIVKE
ncbi:MAG: glycoside hydrolase family 9 protein [Bacteroidota bacterium]|nr:glycoside hydrolase family 9 protein [Bacteroidota bacterium]MDP3147031.1 glycoside hydrolase family 9 protein [Bacteroidota bacterium]